MKKKNGKLIINESNTSHSIPPTKYNFENQPYMRTRCVDLYEKLEQIGEGTYG